MRPVALGLFLLSCAHAERETAGHYFAKGHAYLACNDRPAAGQHIRLVDSHGAVLAEDVSGPDGAYNLHPLSELKVDTKVFVEGGGQRYALWDSYATWMQSGVYEGGQLFVPCGATAHVTAVRDAGAAADDDPPAPPRPPPSKKLLVPSIR